MLGTSRSRNPMRTARTIASGCAILVVSVLSQPRQFEARGIVGGPTCVLGSDQLASIRSDVSKVLTRIDPSLSKGARIQAISSALASIAQSDSKAIGPCAIAVIVADAIGAGFVPSTVVDAVIRGAVVGGLPGPLAIAETVKSAVGAGASAAYVAAAALATGTSIPLAPDLVGQGLGIAAAGISVSNSSAARAIGQTVANEGTQPVRLAFEEAVKSSGGSEELGDVANAFPLAVGETGEGRAIDTGLGNLRESIDCAFVDPQWRKYTDWRC